MSAAVVVETAAQVTKVAVVTVFRMAAELSGASVVEFEMVMALRAALDDPLLRL